VQGETEEKGIIHLFKKKKRARKRTAQESIVTASCPDGKINKGRGHKMFLSSLQHSGEGGQ